MIIGISGSSGSGKSFIVKYLKEHFPKDFIAVVYQDNYYKKREEQTKDNEENYNFDLPTSFLNDELINDINKLKEGQSITRYEYNFNNPKIKPKKILVEPKQLVIIEGLFLFNLPRLSMLLDRKIFIDCNSDLMVKRRIKRDQEKRGYDKLDVIYKYKNHVMPAYQKYILPFRKQVDLIINNNQNDNSGAISALRYIKKEYSI